MKMNWYARMMLVLAGFAALTLASCSDDDPETPNIPDVKMEVAGSYVPFIADPKNDPVGAIGIEATWIDPENIPTIDLTALGLNKQPLNLALNMVNQLAGVYYTGGLAQFDFNADGSVGAKYHKSIGTSFMKPVFSKETFTFPGTDPTGIAAAQAISYYTEGGKLFISVKKAFIAAIGKQENMDLIAIIDGMLAKYPTLDIAATPETYAIPLKYTIGADKSLTLYIDKAMMMPYLPLLTEVVLPLLPENVDMDGGGVIPVRALVTTVFTDLFTKTQSLVISIKLQKIA
ncbi:MAG: hypothetical protein RSB29_05200 [Alistipes sp.]